VGQAGRPDAYQHPGIPACPRPSSTRRSATSTGNGRRDPLQTRAFESLEKLLATGGFDAIFVGSGAPKGKELGPPGPPAGRSEHHIGIDWLESVAFKHLDRIGDRVLIIGVGNTAMDCCPLVAATRRKGREGDGPQTAPVLQGVRVGTRGRRVGERPRSSFNHAPKSFVIEDAASGHVFDQMEYELDARGRIVAERVTGEAFFPADDVILAIGQENRSPGSRTAWASSSTSGTCRLVDKVTFQSTRPEVFFGGDSAFGPKNIIWAVEHGHQAAISIHKFFAMGQTRHEPAATRR